MSSPPDKRNTWVQTDRKALELWGELISRKPRAARLLMLLVARMGDLNAVAVSQKTLSKLLSLNERTIQRAVADLVQERWIQIVKMNGPGTVSAYVINDRVAWGQKRDELRLSMFSAVIIADEEDQVSSTFDTRPLLRIPSLLPGERQLPVGDGIPPPSEPALPGMEPDLPALREPERRAKPLALGELLRDIGPKEL